MNNDRNIGVVQEAYKCFGEWDLPGLLNLFNEDVEWVTPLMENVPQSGTHFGKDGVQDFFTTIGTVQDPEEFLPRHFVASGDSVVAMGNYRFRVKETGK